MIPLITVVVLSSALAIWNRRVVTNVFRRLLSTKEKADTLDFMDRLHVAEAEFEKDLEMWEKTCLQLKSRNEKIDETTRKSVMMLNLDLDFILAKLDEVSGDDEIKSMRKQLVDKFTAYAAKIDSLLAIN